ncbi:MAG TPA: cytochrome c [Anaeromyxobacteraceae bacterium]|nr:cytochrome c [Anaeromyxobacteraceae bacterium]
MVKNKSALLGTAGVATLCVMMSACGANGTTSSVGGVASAGAPVASIALRDSSTPPVARSAPTATDGTFAVDVNGLTPPFLLKAQAATGSAVYSISAHGEAVDVNEMTNVVYAATTESSSTDAAESTFQTAAASQTQQAAGKLSSTLDQLKTVLAPLYSLYGITNPLTDRQQVRAMLRDVSFAVSNGTVTVTNKATGGVIFTGSLSNLAAGTFTAANLPSGTGTTPPPPPAIDGAALYTADCAACHGPLATSSKLGATATQIQGAISANLGGMGALSSLTSAQISAIAAALAPATTPPPPAACTYTYGAWGTCQADGTQTRTVASSTPAGCTGTPVLSQACTYVPPPPAACSYTYSTWGACQSGGTQTRTVLSTTPAGCTGTPVLSQACTYVPPPPAACTYTYGAWGTCQSNGTPTRTVTASTPTGCAGTPVLSQACTYVPPPPAACTYTYSAWGACQSNGTQTRTVTASTPTGCAGTPVLSQACTYVPPVCTYTYSAWGACQSNNTQTRTVTASTPTGCAGTPVLSQACTYTPPIDGAALYTQYCSGCHGTSKKGQPASLIQSAINSNIGGMGSLSFLTPAQIAAISAAP